MSLLTAMLSGPGPADFMQDPWAVALMSPFARLGSFVWGLLWGSFANVLIYRLPRGMSIVSPRSACTRCEKPIAAYDNIPVISFLILRGKCRHCGEPLALRYLIVELLVGFLSFALYMQQVHLPLLQGEEAHLLAWGLWFAFGLGLLVVTYVDLDFWIVPDWIVLPLAVVGVAVAAVDSTVLGVGVIEAAAAAAGGFVVFWGIREFYLRVRKIEGLGLGDAKLLAMVGAFTGLQGLIFCVGAGALQGVLVSVPMLRSGRNVANTDLEEVHGDDPELGEEDAHAGVMGRRVPFGPFLALAAMEYVLLRSHIDDLAQWLIFPS